MTAALAMIRVTIRQLTGKKRTIGFALLGVLPAGLLLALSRAREIDGLDTDLGVLLVAPLFAFVIPITSVLMAGSALGDERRDKTLSFIVLRPIRRLSIVVSKTVAACFVSVGFALFSSVALVLTYTAVGGSADVLPAIAIGAILTCVIYSSVFVLVGNVISRSTVVGLIYVLFVENVLAQELPRLAAVSPWRVGLGATIDLMPQGFPARAIFGAIGELIPSVQNAVVATVVVVIVTVSACTLLLRRTDSV